MVTQQSGGGGGQEQSGACPNPLSQVSGRALLPLAQGFPGGSEGKASAYNADTRVSSLGREDPLEKEMATHSSTHAWKISWTKKPGRLQSTGSQRVGQD